MQEEKKNNKFKNAFKMFYKVISYTIIIELMIISSFLILCFISGRIAASKGQNPSMALYTIISPSMTPNINVYDVIFVKKTDPNKLKKGDVITFYSTNPYFGNTPITHRIVNVINDNGKLYFETKGDANSINDEEKIPQENVIGKVYLKVPKLGKINEFLTTKKGIIIAILIPSLIIIAYDVFKIFRLIILRSKIVALDVVKPEIVSLPVEEEQEDKKE